MSDSPDAGFGQFIPGFDFLQNLTKGASQALPQMPNLANWIAPTLNVEELDKRISELKAVHFWLDQNSKALGATVQALEVQRMTLATLKGMNFNVGDLANALKAKPADAPPAAAPKAAEKPSAPVQPPVGAAGEAAAATDKVRKPAKPAKPAPGLVDPMQLWGSLTQQFQQIAASAMQDAGKQAAMDLTRNLAGGLAKDAVAAKKTPAKAARARAPAKKAAKKSTGRGA